MTLGQFKAFSKSKGSHWFDAGTMQFFGSKVSNWHSSTGYFITSEQPPHGERVYSIRLADFTSGDVMTIGAFGQYKTLALAKSAMSQLVFA